MDYSVFNLKFSLEIEMSAFEKAGTDAFVAYYPANSDDKQMFFTVVKISSDFLQQSGMPPEAVDMYVKSTFFGVATTAQENLSLKVAGQEVIGEVLEKSMPKPLDLYFLKLKTKDNSYIYIGIEVAKNKDLARKIISEFEKTAVLV